MNLYFESAVKVTSVSKDNGFIQQQKYSPEDVEIRVLLT